MPGSPVYEFSGDANGDFGCTTRLAIGYAGLSSSSLASCTGPESDFVNHVSDDEWPALTTTGEPVAGPGVDQKLLGTVERPGIGDQVTYGGHPLYLFDHPSYTFFPEGDGYLESVAPMHPWHGIWYLVSAQDGRPAPGGVAVAAPKPCRTKGRPSPMRRTCRRSLRLRLPFTPIASTGRVSAPARGRAPSPGPHC